MEISFQGTYNTKAKQNKKQNLKDVFEVEGNEFIGRKKDHWK